VFLDVQMPRMSGFEVVEALDEAHLPLIVFATAYDQCALRAFEVSACDYLLKPFDADRVARTMRRVLDRQRTPADGGELRALLAHVGGRPARVVVRTDGKHVFVDADVIDWIEAVGKDIRFHIGGTVLPSGVPLTCVEQRLDPAVFARVHRSAIVNRAHVREIQPWFKGDFVLVLRNGTRVVSGRTHRETVLRMLAG
jgi:two-component system LytT family response regulator